MEAESQRAFDIILDEIQKSKKYQEALKTCDRKYELPNCVIKNLNPAKIREIYLLTSQRFKESEKNKENWLQNQKKLFLWLLICWIHARQIQVPSLRQSDYQLLSSVVNRKSVDLLRYEAFSLLNKSKKRIWEAEQDKILVQIMKDEQTRKSGEWTFISRKLFVNSLYRFIRSPKQCRERWLNHLDPQKVKGEWSIQQDFALMKSVRQIGKKWAQIVVILNNTKSQHMVKNRYHSLIHKKKKSFHTKKQEQLCRQIIDDLKQIISKKKEQKQFAEEFQNIGLISKEKRKSNDIKLIQSRGFSTNSDLMQQLSKQLTLTKCIMENLAEDSEQIIPYNLRSSTFFSSTPDGTLSFRPTYSFLDKKSSTFLQSPMISPSPCLFPPNSITQTFQSSSQYFKNGIEKINEGLGI